MTTLMNLRIPTKLKDEFNYYCRNNSTYMTTEIIRMIQKFIHEERDLLSKPKPTFRIPPKGKQTIRRQDDDGWVSPQMDDHRDGWMERSEYGDW